MLCKILCGKVASMYINTQCYTLSGHSQIQNMKVLSKSILFKILVQSFMHTFLYILSSSLLLNWYYFFVYSSCAEENLEMQSGGQGTQLLFFRANGKIQTGTESHV